MRLRTPLRAPGVPCHHGVRRQPRRTSAQANRTTDAVATMATPPVFTGAAEEPGRGCALIRSQLYMCSNRAAGVTAAGLVVLPGPVPEWARAGTGPDHGVEGAVRLPARAARERAGGGPAGHMAVFCNAAPGCRPVWYRPRHEPAGLAPWHNRRSPAVAAGRALPGPLAAAGPSQVPAARRRLPGTHGPDPAVNTSWSRGHHDHHPPGTSSHRRPRRGDRHRHFPGHPGIPDGSDQRRERPSGRRHALSLLWAAWGALVFELQHFANGVDFLVEWDDKRHDGRLRGVVYDRAEMAQDATQLAVSLQVPLMAARDLPDRPQTATLHLP
jgi:hypothetical protein